MTRPGRQSGKPIAEIVMLFDSEGISHQMTFEELLEVIARGLSVADVAGQRVKAIFAEVGTGLVVQSMVCFYLVFDDNGQLPRDWSLPLRDLAKKAGPGPDLGVGAIGLASRAQCSIPWHTASLWQPDLDDLSESELMMAQRLVWRNRMRLPVGQDVQSPADEEKAWLEGVQKTNRPGLSGNSRLPPRPRQNVTSTGASAEAGRLNQKISSVFGDDPKVSVSQLVQLYQGRLKDMAAEHEKVLTSERQSNARATRQLKQRIERLEADLRSEQERSRRLQDLLRGQLAV